MNKIMLGTAVACLGLAMTGCITKYQNDGGDACRAPVIAKDIVHEKYTLSQKPVSANDTVFCLFGFITFGSSASHVADAVCAKSELAGPVSIIPSVKDIARNGAYANACDAAKCDAIAGAKYKVQVDNYFVFKKARAEITGYPATLTGVELIENKTPCCKR